MSALLCKCKERLADACHEEWGPSCDLGNNERFAEPVRDMSYPLGVVIDPEKAAALCGSHSTFRESQRP